VKPRRLPLLLQIAIVTLAPAWVRADNLGATRVPPQVRTLQNAPAEADPSSAAAADSGTPGRITGSRTLGGGKKDSSTTRIESTAESLAAPGGVLGMEPSSVDGKDSVTAPTGATPELHVVQKGDTLWSLCSKYFADPWRWPRLWAANPMITNPHWIFPGDIIKLSDGSAAAAALPPAAAPAEPVRTGLMSVNRVGVDYGNAFMLREMGFIEAKDLDQAGTVSGSREEKIMLATGDQVYLRSPEKQPLRAGERYSVFQTDTEQPVVDASTGKTYGYLVRIKGDLIVNQIAESGVARGTLVDTVVPIERGERVSGFVRQFKRIETRPSEVNLEARVISTFEPNLLLGSGHFVILNRGRRDGVQVGNRTFVIRRGDGYRATLETWEKHDPKMPKEVVGEILVLEVRDDASVAWIARSTKELKVGELTEMRKGH
jgi:hypothetical protein